MKNNTWLKKEPTKPGQYMIAIFNTATESKFIQSETLLESGEWVIESRQGYEQPARNSHLIQLGWKAYPVFPEKLFLDWIGF